MDLRSDSMGPGFRALATPLGLGLAHFAAALTSLIVARWSNGLAAIWLPNAFLVAYLILQPRERWPAACLAVWASGAAANWLGGAPIALAAMFGLTNALEPLIVVSLIAAERRSSNFERVDDLLRFAAAAAVASSAAATIASAATSVLSYARFAEVWPDWFFASFLGLVTVTPLLLIGSREFGRGLVTRRTLLELAGLMGLVAAGALGALMLRWPMMFIAYPPVVLATFRLRAFGAASATLVIALIGVASIVLGLRPAVLAEISISQQMVVLQAFLLTILLTTLPIAAILSQRDQVSNSLAEREAQLASIVDAVNDVIFRTDVQGRWTYLNPAWEALTGQAVEEAIGRSVLENVVEEDRAELSERMRGLTLGLFDSVRHQFRFRNASGEHRWGEVQSHRLLASNGEMIGAAGIIVDISDRLALAAMADDARRRAERDAEAAMLLASTDELTGVASRRAFLAVLDQHLEAGQALAIALFDIDHFKQVNDRYGHAVGDEVLQRVAALAEGAVRDRDVVGRLGGEEFAVLMPGASLDAAARIGERLRRTCAEAFHPPGIPVTVSVGVSAAEGAATASELLREADMALYRAKFDGRNCLRLAA
jgi:diguanylate cyclase (GGDEF)-like protein/PAS domain S-box-containing protein